MAAEREALRMGVEILRPYFHWKHKNFNFVVENERGNTKYKVDMQSMRLLGLCNDHTEDECVHSDTLELKSKRRKTE